MSDLKFYSSNQSKLDEYRKYGLPATLHKGKDIREVLSEPSTVCIYKALEIPNNCLVEDTSFFVEGASVGVDIKFRIDELKTMVGKRALAKVVLAHKKDGLIFVYEANVFGWVTSPIETSDKVFGFDGVFTPECSSICLHEVKKLGTLNHLVPRWIVTQNFINGCFTNCVKVSSILPWSGEYQQE